MSEHYTIEQYDGRDDWLRRGRTRSIGASETAEVEYREIERFPGYRFGSDGSVWTQWTRGRHGLGDWRQRRPQVDKDGYGIATVRVAKGAGKTYRIARLILEAFCGPCPEGFHACHCDGCITNNAIGNLRWDSPKANNADKRRHGTDVLRERRVLTFEDAERIREMRRGGATYKAIAKAFGVSGGVVWQIVAMKTYRVA